VPYLIDTDWLIDQLANVPEAGELLERLSSEGIAISVVTYMEVYEGTIAIRGDQPLVAEQLEELLPTIPILGVDTAVARRCAELRNLLRRQGKRISNRALDLIIASTALEHGLTLVTRNTRDYADIPDLELYRPT